MNYNNKTATKIFSQFSRLIISVKAYFFKSLFCLLFSPVIKREPIWDYLTKHLDVVIKKKF